MKNTIVVNEKKGIVTAHIYLGKGEKMGNIKELDDKFFDLAADWVINI